jgi:hypothetical protein
MRRPSDWLSMRPREGCSRPAIATRVSQYAAAWFNPANGVPQHTDSRARGRRRPGPVPGRRRAAAGYFMIRFQTLSVRPLPAFDVKSAGRSLPGAAKQNFTVSPSHS